MSAIKISELPAFVGKKLLLEAQAKGVEIVGKTGDTRVILDAAAVTLIGLASLLVERGVMKEPS